MPKDRNEDRWRSTRANAARKRPWSRIIIPIVIVVVAAVPAWSMFGVMLLDPRTFLQGLFAASSVFVAVGALPWFLYVYLSPQPVNQRPEVDAPKFSAESLVWRASNRNGQPVSVVVDQAADRVHFQNCAILRPLLLGSPLPWFSCSLSDLRSFHESPMKHVTALVIKTNFGKVTVLFVSGDNQALIHALTDVIPGGHRRFHEDHPLVFLLMIFFGFSAALLAFCLVPERLPPNTFISLVLGPGVVVALAVRQAISFWSGKASQRR